MTRPTTDSLQPEILQLDDHARQHRLRGRGAEHDQQLLLDVPDEPPDAEPGEPGNSSEHDEDEEEAGQVERRHQLAEREQRDDAVFPDREGHGAEGADRRRPHDNADDVEQAVRYGVNKSDDGLAALAHHVQSEREQDRDEQHLQDLALGKRANHRVGYDVEQEFDGALRPALVV